MADILFVDDAEDAHTLLDRILRRSKRDDLRMESAKDGNEALERLADRDFDLVLSDVNMPFLDGPGLIEAMRARGDETPVALVGALMLEAHSGAIEQVHKTDLFARPIETIDRLLALATRR